ncbi:hypothetical protein [Microvirga sp. TS319]|jgi:hypothetical protein|uniref:hypothetical protein n=1 Tax=Microvirga sp. TS319 TaxID=3241165 RepID=UPI00351A026C
MKIRSVSAALALGVGLFAAAEAQAWFAGIEDDRPPPNGANGVSANGVTLNGLTSQGLASDRIEAVVLADGSRVVLK